MGAKQSKRSVDISGKEAEGAGEVAAAGAGGEGRVEQLADADALKPQLNGDVHIHEQTDKDKQLDSGTPENEKDATTEKEGKQEEIEEKEVSSVTNGDSAEQKTENGDSTPAPEDSKKPKKEKVKKKWSLRSISFSRKDKPKQEKKPKEDDSKTNGEPEKVPEEAAEVTTESAANEVAEVKSEKETNEEKTPETPVTEPITNGSNTPESPKVEIAPAVEAAPVASPEPEQSETKAEPEPEKLPINGLSIEEPKEAPEVVLTEGSKPEESPAEPTESVPAIEIPVQKEVCVDQMPLIESTPPPLPANPPPSSVASFAATTMAPDLTDASLANTAETAISTPPVLDTKTDSPKECLVESSQTVLINNETDINVPSLFKTNEGETEASNKNVEDLHTTVEAHGAVEETEILEKKEDVILNVVDIKTEEVLNGTASDDVETPVSLESPTLPETPESEASDAAGDLPPPPPPEIDDSITDDDAAIETIEPPALDANILNSNHTNVDIVEVNGVDDGVIVNGNDDTEQENAKNKTKDALGNATIECNGNVDSEADAKDSMSESLPPSPSEAGAGAASDSFPAPPSDLAASPDPQEPVLVSDKLADLIPEVPVVPELNTETLQEASDVAVAN